jgi:hypothetical protein
MTKTFSTLLYEQFYQKQVRKEREKCIIVNILGITHTHTYIHTHTHTYTHTHTHTHIYIYIYIYIYI